MMGLSHLREAQGPIPQGNKLHGNGFESLTSLPPLHEPAINSPPMPYSGKSCVECSMSSYLFNSKVLLFHPVIYVFITR